MTKMAILAGLASAALLFPAPTRAEDDAAVKEMAKFDGTWKFESLEMNGKAVPVAAYKDSALVLDGKKFTFQEGDQKTEGTYSIEPSKKPKTIDVTFTSGPQSGQSMKGIYELDGDTYKVCFSMSGKDRPTEFATKAGDGKVLEVLKKSKP